MLALPLGYILSVTPPRCYSCCLGWVRPLSLKGDRPLVHDIIDLVRGGVVASLGSVQSIPTLRAMRFAQ